MENFKKNIKCGLTFVGDTVSEIASSVAEKNRLRVQLNHIKALIKADTATRDQAFIELGRYFYENMREDTTAENEAICAVVDAANDRISKASIKYVELLNIQNDTKIRSENAEKLAKAVSIKAAEAAKAAKEKAAEAAEKVKATATDLAEKAKDKAADIKERLDPESNSDLEELIAAEQEKAEKAVSDAAEDAAEAVREVAEESAEAVEKVVPEAVNEESPEDIGF